MHNSQTYKQQGSIQQTSTKRLSSVVLHWLMLFSVLLLFTASNANADMVFDFQKKMADKGNAEAQFKVGEMYQTGRGVDKDTAEAVKWFEKAVANGHAQAGYRLLYLSIQKDGLNAENKAAAKELSNKAKAGDGVAQLYLGMMYHNGVGLEQNNDKALEWYKKAELQGMTAAEQGRIEVTAAKSNAAAEAKLEAEARKKADAKADAIKQAELEKKKQAEQAKAKAEAENAKAAKTDAQSQQAAAKAAQAQKQAADEAEEREKKRQALIKARQDRDNEQKASNSKESGKTEFEADPCSGKSARFLSTCK